MTDCLRRSSGKGRRTRPGRPAFVLFLMAPFVGEFLLGNLTLAELPLGLLLAPLYGFGAILVRELGRRYGGWPTMTVLAVAYALIEEGPVDQLLWNSDYAGVDYVHGPGYVEVLGLNVMTVQVVIALHAVWSICVPIAITEALYPRSGAEPWLSRRGLVAVGLWYVAGAGMVCWGNWSEERFWASPAQIGGISMVIVTLIVVALRLRPSEASVPRAAPHPGWAVGLGLVLTSAYWGPVNLATSRTVAWAGFAVWWVALLLGVGLPTAARGGWSAGG
jgi:hypothetical protein